MFKMFTGGPRNPFYLGVFLLFGVVIIFSASHAESATTTDTCLHGPS